MHTFVHTLVHWESETGANVVIGLEASGEAMRTANTKLDKIAASTGNSAAAAAKSLP